MALPDPLAGLEESCVKADGFDVINAGLGILVRLAINGDGGGGEKADADCWPKPAPGPMGPKLGGGPMEP
jgi:hypothetical protein